MPPAAPTALVEVNVESCRSEGDACGGAFVGRGRRVVCPLYPAVAGGTVWAVR